MKMLLCSTVLATVILGAYSYPNPIDENPIVPQQIVDAEKQLKQNLFGIGVDINLSKNGTLIPTPAFINTSANFASGVGAGGNFIVPLVPFPLGLLFPAPPLNITVGFNANKNLTLALAAAAGNASASDNNNSDNSGWPSAPAPGWTTPPPAPPPSGWGWTTAPPPPPPPAWGWTTAAPPPPPGWGWKQPQPVKKGVAPANNKPQNSGPKPNSIAKPAPAPEQARPAGDASSPIVLSNVAQSSLSSEYPSAESPAQAPESVPAAVESNAIVAPLPEAVQQQDIPKPAEIPAPAPAHSKIPDKQKPLPISAPKAKRHAGVEVPAALRIEDFEDVEASNEMHAPPMQEQMEEGHEISKEEMIIMAMEQASVNSAGAAMQLGNARPAPLRPTLNQLQVMNKPLAENDEAAAVDLRNAESAAVPAVENSKSKGKPDAEVSNNAERGGRNKPRPYGMDKPSKSRPNLESKDKVEQFGLPHYSPSSDLVQKEQFQLGGSNVLGFQIPEIKWSSFATIFQNLLGSRHKNSAGMGKSDAAVASEADKCIDNEDENEAIRSPVIQGGFLCQSQPTGGCEFACKQSGFAGGNCLGPPPTPGCLCKVPNHKELGMMISPLKAVVANEGDLAVSDSAVCKKCACAESCKLAGSYTGFCIDKCYCGVPWYTKQEA